MAVGEFVEEELFTEVSQLPEAEFIDRYAGILGLRDNVRTAKCYGVDYTTLEVAPDTYESRVDGTRMYREALRRIGADEQADMLAEAVPPQEPMSDEEIAALADRIKGIRSRQEAYSELGLVRKVGHNVLTLFGRESFAVTAEDARLANLPDVIVHTQHGTGIRAVIINAGTVQDTVTVE